MARHKIAAISSRHHVRKHVIAKSKAMKKAACNTAPQANSSEQNVISQAAIQKHGDLHKAIESFQKGKITGDELMKGLQAPETQRLWKHFEYFRNQDEDAKSDWQSVSSLKRGEGKDSKKRMLLLAWLKEKKFGKHYLAISHKLDIRKSLNKELKWLTWEELKKNMVKMKLSLG